MNDTYTQKVQSNKTHKQSPRGGHVQSYSRKKKKAVPYQQHRKMSRGRELYISQAFLGQYMVFKVEITP